MIGISTNDLVLDHCSGGPISDDLVELLAGRLRLLADPTRIRILARLRDGPASVQQLIDAVGTSQQNISKHLTRLSADGLVAWERRGNEHHYRLGDPSPMQVLDLFGADFGAR
jgi:DNA-binding transcriptional ArsR family regulator